MCVQIPWDKNPEALAKWAEVREHTSSLQYCPIFSIC